MTQCLCPSSESTYSLSALESKLVSYITSSAAAEKPFDIVSIPKISKEQARQEAQRARNESSSILPSISAGPSVPAEAAAGPSPTAAEAQSRYVEQLKAVPDFKDYGDVLKSSTKPVELTESETEYVVNCVKHIFAEHIVFQFNITNTIADTVLDNVTVLMSPSEDSGLTEDFILPLPSLAAQESGIVYVSFTRDSPEDYATASFTNTLRFVSKEVDPETGEPQEDGYDDEYQTEDVELSAGDYITPSYATFATEWDRLRSGSTATETFALTALDSLKGMSVSH